MARFRDSGVRTVSDKGYQGNTNQFDVTGGMSVTQPVSFGERSQNDAYALWFERILGTDGVERFASFVEIPRFVDGIRTNPAGNGCVKMIISPTDGQLKLYILVLRDNNARNMLVYRTGIFWEPNA